MPSSLVQHLLRSKDTTGEAIREVILDHVLRVGDFACHSPSEGCLRDLFLLQHQPRGLTEADQDNACRTRAPRHTLYQRSQGAMTTRTLYSYRDHQSTVQTS